MSLTVNSAINPNVTINELLGFLKSKYEIVEQRYLKNSSDSESCILNIKKTPSSKWISLFLSINKTPIETRHDDDSLLIDNEIIKEYLFISSFGSHTNEHIDLLKEMCEIYGGALSEEDREGCNFKWVNRNKFFEKRCTFEEYLTYMLSPESMEILVESAKKFNIKLF